jgi:uncharacterized protein YprB with RNaseH-like and TPR domain
MPETMPQNTTEAAYIAFALVDELLDLLVSRNLLDALSVKSLFESVTERLLQENNLGVNRAAQFVANRMSGKE